MTLSSFKYIAFLAAVSTVYFLLPKKARPAFLLAASYGFYALWSVGFALLLASASLVSWLCALFYERGLLGKDRLWLRLGLVYLFGMLLLYKYLGFFVNSALALSGSDHVFQSAWLLPAGISFYTFTAASYLFDVGRGKVRAEKSPVYFGLYMAFFPSILSGPINRAGSLLPQLRAPEDFSYERMKRGLMRFAVGAVKKLVAADTLGLFVNSVYAELPSQGGGILALAAAAYSLQIYFDFAGYTDMALGSAELLGFTLCENFRAPYLVTSVKSFWKNWHISLTSWFREYLYFPLGGSRVSKERTYVNILIVFAVSGLWHGADWSFVLWGLLNGLYQVIGQICEPIRIKKESKGLDIPRCLFTFMLITAAWVFFRADSTGDALYILKSILLIPVQGLGFMNISAHIGLKQLALALMVSLAVGLDDYILCKRGKSFTAELADKSFAFWLVLALLAFSVLLFGIYGEGFEAQSFVYFNF